MEEYDPLSTKQRDFGEMADTKNFCIYPHQQGCDTVKQHHTSPFRTTAQLLGLDHSLCSPSSPPSAPEVFQNKIRMG